MEVSLALERRMNRSVRTAASLPTRVGSFLEDFQKLDTRRAMALLQTILKAARVYRDGTIELEFRS